MCCVKNSWKSGGADLKNSGSEPRSVVLSWRNASVRNWKGTRWAESGMGGQEKGGGSRWTPTGHGTVVFNWSRSSALNLYPVAPVGSRDVV